jgi:hypothetical protein
MLLPGLIPGEMLLLGVLDEAAPLPDELTGEMLPAGLFAERMLLLGVLEGPALTIEDGGAGSGVKLGLGAGSLLDTRSAGHVPQDPLKKPQGFPRKHCQWPSDVVQVRMATQLGSALGLPEGVSELLGPGGCVRKTYSATTFC